MATSCLNNPIVRFFITIARWTPVAFIFAVVSWAYYAYVYQLCINTVESNTARIFFLIVINFLLVMFLWSYYKTVMTSVGAPPQSFFLTSEVKEDLSLAQNDKEFRAILDRFVRQTGIPVHNRNFDGSIRFCLKCSCVKPDRAHHCSVCGQCVLKFDHHCPWVNSCVNFSNYKFFLLFLGYGLVLCLFAFFTTMPYFIEIWSNNGLHKDFGRVHVLFIFFVSGMFALSLGCLFFYHLYLTAVNRSTVESIRPPTFLHGPDKNGYNLGFRRNYREIFGKNKILWFIPVFTSHGNGVTYPIGEIVPDRYTLLSTRVNDGDSSTGSEEDELFNRQNDNTFIV